VSLQFLPSAPIVRTPGFHGTDTVGTIDAIGEWAAVLRRLASTPAVFDGITALAIAIGVLWVTVACYYLLPATWWVFYRRRAGRSAYADAADALADEELPTIDVLLPAYEEAAVIEQCITSVRSADYPQELITINVLVEPSDTRTAETLSALTAEHEFASVQIPSGYMTRIVVPERYLGEANKPRALNFGFHETYGDVVGILDAEDVVDPDLFREVAGALVAEDYDYVQGILDMSNERDGWKNALFRGEYGFWYRLLLPGYHTLGWPVPLGGTTNFFRREVLTEISEIRKTRFGNPWDTELDGADEGNEGGDGASSAWLAGIDTDRPIPWDPVNVTEDFELGILLWLEGYDLGLIDAVTREESPVTVRGWIRQRTRWQKGKLYTLVQYLRHRPARARETVHVVSQAATPHLGPINVAGVLVVGVLTWPLGYVGPRTVQVLTAFGIAFVAELMAFHAYGYWRASARSTRAKLLPAAANFLTLPAYWLLLWTAEFRAIKQFYNVEHHWEKTEHHGRHHGSEDEERDDRTEE